MKPFIVNWPPGVLYYCCISLSVAEAFCTEKVWEVLFYIESCGKKLPWNVNQWLTPAETFTLRIVRLWIRAESWRSLPSLKDESAEALSEGEDNQEVDWELLRFHLVPQLRSIGEGMFYHILICFVAQYSSTLPWIIYLFINGRKLHPWGNKVLRDL